LIHADKGTIVPSRNDSNQPNPQPNYEPEYPIGKPQSDGAEPIIPNFEKRKFSYSDLKKITNDFKNNIGTGGYGSVYLGHLENGFQVAVKMLSQSSTQGVREFLAEVITPYIPHSTLDNNIDIWCHGDRGRGV
jgi:hypothetical protein